MEEQDIVLTPKLLWLNTLLLWAIFLLILAFSKETVGRLLQSFVPAGFHSFLLPVLLVDFILCVFLFKHFLDLAVKANSGVNEALYRLPWRYLALPVVLLVACEEAAFRFLLQGHFLQNLPVWLAIFLASLAWTLLHGRYLAYAPAVIYILLLGALYGLLYAWNGVLFWPFLAHLIHNVALIAYYKRHPLKKRQKSIL